MVVVNYRQDGKLHNTANFTYLGDGRRIRSVYKTYNGGLAYLLENTHAFNDPDYVYEEVKDGDLEFKDGKLTKMDIPNGYIKTVGNNGGYTLDVRYFLADYLGSIRTVCDAQSGSALDNIEYLPSGMVFRTNWLGEQKLRFCGKEELTMHGYNVYDSGARFQYSRYPRDPLAEKYYSWSPYAYCMGNPVNAIDPDGRSTHTDSLGNVMAVYNDGNLGIYKHNISLTDYDGSHLGSGNESYTGKTLEWNSFILAEEGTPLGTIDFGSFEAADVVFGSFQRNSLVSDSQLMRLMDYGMAANNGETYDLKAIGGFGNKSHYYRGSQIAKGIYVSMRDAGNMLAGMIAKRNGLSAEKTYSLFGALQLSGNSRWSMLFKYAKARKRGSNGSYGELPISHAFQRRGYEMRFTH